MRNLKESKGTKGKYGKKKKEEPERRKHWLREKKGEVKANRKNAKG